MIETVADLLARLERLGVVLTREGDDLMLDAPKGILTGGLRERIAFHKNDLLRGLTEATAENPPKTQTDFRHGQPQPPQDVTSSGAENLPKTQTDFRHGQPQPPQGVASSDAENAENIPARAHAGEKKFPPPVAPCPEIFSSACGAEKNGEVFGIFGTTPTNPLQSATLTTPKILEIGDEGFRRFRHPEPQTLTECDLNPAENQFGGLSAGPPSPSVPLSWHCQRPLCRHGTRWWRSVYDVVNCLNCVPPAAPWLVAETGGGDDEADPPSPSEPSRSPSA